MTAHSLRRRNFKLGKETSKKPAKKPAAKKNVARKKVLAKIAAREEALREARDDYSSASIVASASRKEARRDTATESRAHDLVYKRSWQLEKAKEALVKFDTRAEICKEGKEAAKKAAKKAAKPEPVQVSIIAEDDDMGADEDTDERPTDDDDMGADEETP